MGTLPSPSLTDPDVRISRIRFFERDSLAAAYPWLILAEAGDGVSGFR